MKQIQLSRDQINFVEDLLWDAMQDQHDWMFNVLDKHAHRNTDSEIDDVSMALTEIEDKLPPDTRSELHVRLYELSLCDGLFRALGSA